MTVEVRYHQAGGLGRSVHFPGISLPCLNLLNDHFLLMALRGVWRGPKLQREVLTGTEVLTWLCAPGQVS